MSKITQGQLFQYLALHPGEDIDLCDLENFVNPKKENINKEQLDSFEESNKVTEENLRDITNTDEDFDFFTNHPGVEMNNSKNTIKPSESFSKETFPIRKVKIGNDNSVKVKSATPPELITENYMTKEIPSAKPKYRREFHIPKILAPDPEMISKISFSDKTIVAKKPVKRDFLMENQAPMISEYGKPKAVNCKYAKLMKEDSDFSNHIRVREICRLLEGNSKIKAFNTFFKFDYAVRFLNGDISTDDVLNKVRKFNKSVESDFERRLMEGKENYDKAVKLKNKIESMGHKYLYNSVNRYNFSNIMKRLEIRVNGKLTIPKNKNLVKKVGNISDEEYLEDYLERFKEFVENIWKETGLPSEVSNEIKLFYIVVRGRYEQLTVYDKGRLGIAHRYQRENNLSFDDIRNMHEMHKGSAIFWIIDKYKFEDIINSSDYRTIKNALVIPTYSYEMNYDSTNELFVKATLPFDKVVNTVLTNYKNCCPF